MQKRASIGLNSVCVYIETTGPVSLLADNLSLRISSTKLVRVSVLFLVLYHWDHYFRYLINSYQVNFLNCSRTMTSLS